MKNSYSNLLKIGKQLLSDRGIETPELDAELLMMECFGIDRAFLFLHGDKIVDQKDADLYLEWVERRSRGIPLQYIIGTQEFMGLTFRVTPAVLIPRQDTETLVECVLEEIRSITKDRSEGRETDLNECKILDMCCGSGAIAVSVAHYLKQRVEITAVDISEEALAIARENAEKNGVASSIRFVQGDMFKQLDATGFDLILSNPPYIPSQVISTLQAEVQGSEPHLALDGGADGLDFYRILAEEAQYFLKPGGQIIVEIGHDQGEDVSLLFQSEGCYDDIVIINDLAGNTRVVKTRLIEKIEKLS